MEGPARFRRVYHVDTKGLCLLCVKECKKPYSTRCNNGVDFNRVFIVYMNIDFYDDIVKPSNFKWESNKVEKVEIQLCEDCDYLAFSFMKVYNEIELLQMRLDQYTGIIWDIMRLSRKISSKVTLYEVKMKINVTGKV